MITLVDCQTVLAVLEDRHIARAARRLGVTQPALTARLQRIEREIGTLLFERSRSGVRPTPAGLSFAEGARRTIEAAERALEMARNAADGLGETLLLGTTQVSAYRIVPAVLASFRAQQPQARIRLTEATTASLEARLEAREIDAAFLHPPLHASALTERHLVTGKLVRVNFADAGEGLVINYPRAEAPVLMGRLGREREKAGRRSIAEADTMLGALTLSRAGYGECIVERDYVSAAAGESFRKPPETAGSLEISVAWRAADNREIVRTLVACAIEMADRQQKAEPT